MPRRNTELRNNRIARHRWYNWPAGQL